MDETKTGIANLKAHLSEYLARARCGERVVVYDRNTPIAVIEPYCQPDALRLRRPTLPISEAVGREPIPTLKPTDAVAMLLEDREREAF